MYHIDTSIEAILQQVHQLKIREGESAMLLFGEASQVDIPQLIERLTQEGISFFGGLFPGIIHGTQNHDAGYLLQKLQLAHPPIVIENLDKDVIELPDIPTRTDAKNTVLTFVDGLTANISGYLQQLYHHFGDSANFLGGMSGNSMTSLSRFSITMGGCASCSFWRR
ncbi:MAG: FIST N-terminal domain-containing protein [Bacteroidota bacterium]